MEDSTGSPYCLTAEDEAFLKNNFGKDSKQSAALKHQVETIISYYELNIPSDDQKSTNLDMNYYKDLLRTLDLNVNDGTAEMAREIFHYWRSQRLNQGNRYLLARLKHESGKESDDVDPFVCFRRREVRQVRKTRGRDAQVVEKLKKLRKELESARRLVKLVNQRESRKYDIFMAGERIFQSRVAIKDTKRSLCIKGDDGDLISQKVRWHFSKL